MTTMLKEAFAEIAPFKNTSGFNPLDLRVVVRPEEVETVTAGGIHLPASRIDKDKYAQTSAVLVAAGDNAFKDWGDATRPKPGDRVTMAQYAGKMHKGKDGLDYRICNDSDVLALEDE